MRLNCFISDTNVYDVICGDIFKFACNKSSTKNTVPYCIRKVKIDTIAHQMIQLIFTEQSV